MRRISHYAILLAGLVSTGSYGQTMHPVFPLIDQQGVNVLKSSRAVNAAKTCGRCHDTDYIAANTTPGHASQAQQTGATLSRLKRGSTALPASGMENAAAMNCFLCHLQQPNNVARIAALSGSAPEWAATATLEGSGVVIKAPDGWQYQRKAFSIRDELLPEYSQMQDPQNRHCGFCHGQVHSLSKTPLMVDAGNPEQWTTFTTGQVISPQLISDSGLNLSGKESLTRSWDVHSERLLECVNCHFSLNNPAQLQSDPEKQPTHLAYSPRRLDIKEYLNQPSHILAGSALPQRSGQPLAHSAMRRCENCHDFNRAHGWLPFKTRHENSLGCETCHIPQIYAPAAAVIDLTTDKPGVLYRGAAASMDLIRDLSTGYQPLILARLDNEGRKRLAPYNLITTWAIRGGDKGQPGMLSGEVHPYAIHHDVAHGKFVIRDCQACHDQNSILSGTMRLTASRSGNSPALWKSDELVLPSGGIVQKGDALYFVADIDDAGFYILGHSKVAWVQCLGAALMLLTLAGILLHGILRYRTRRNRASDHEPTHLVYMYEVYERYWHWLQAIVIIGLIFTGLTIHAPSRFAWLSFAAAVRVHNILAALLLFNAFLSLFYHFASGKIRTYLPEPSGFFNQAFMQARFYLRGIFKGEAHPFEKSPQKKLNPLQKITYLVILNLLLPLQIVTGILIAGAQVWPGLSQMLGGLGFLVPIHSLLAWLFAAFLILHIYLTTTGHTPLASIKAMILGWEKVPVHPEEK